VYQLRVHQIEELLDIWHGLKFNRVQLIAQLMENAPSCQRRTFWALTIW